MLKAVIYARVSTTDQHTENQVPVLEERPQPVILEPARLRMTDREPHRFLSIGVGPRRPVVFARKMTKNRLFSGLRNLFSGAILRRSAP